MFAVGLVSSQFSPGEFGSIIIAWIVLSFGITYASFVGLLNGTGGNLDFVIAGFVATATGFIIHEMGHKFVAIRRGYVAHFRLWTWGLMLTLFTAVATGGSFLFGAPGAVYIAPAAAVGSGNTPFRDLTIRGGLPEDLLIEDAGLSVLFVLAFANGANDVGKSVASLMHLDPGGKTSRRPLLWGGFFSSLGSVSAVLISGRLFSVFTPQSILRSSFDS